MTITLNKKRTSLLKLTYTAVLTAIIFLLEITHIGYIPLLGIAEITVMVVPVAVGAVIAGPVGGAFLGFIFGLTSFIQCFKGSVFGAAILSASLIGTVITCFVPHILMGLLCGLIYKLFTQLTKMKYLSCVITSVSAAVLNTVFFMTSLIICFGRSEYIISMMDTLGVKSLLSFAVAFVGINGIIEAIVSAIIGFFVASVLVRFLPDASPTLRHNAQSLPK